METSIATKHLTISVTELDMRLKQGERLQMIDVRSPQEFDEGHIPGSVNVPLEHVESRLADLHPTDSAVLVCRSGNRAQMCKDILDSHRKGLMVLEGGTVAWMDQGLPVVRTTASRLPLMRQVHIAAGTMALAGAALGYFVNPAWGFLAMFVGGGLLLAGATGFCGMANLLALMPWNKAPKSGLASQGSGPSNCCTS